ncbi:MAG: DUF2163 domain-containing protein [Betaproteobacteria bacterium]|nr:DUF2163 domain-containing protein [Betaproteobacteria bacterium]
MRTDISVALKAHYASGSTTLARCWKATLTNGTVVTATAHDRDIVFDGRTYLSTAAYTPSDVESGSDLSPDNLELEGFLASPHIVASDVQTGLWDYAAIEFFEVNYRDLTMGRNLIRAGTLGEVSTGLASFRAELRGVMQAYSRRIVRLTQATCDADLGDARCKIVLATWTVTGTIDSVTSNRQFTDAARTEATDWFTGGKITFTSGLNNGLSMEVKESTSAGVIKLHELMPFDIAAGDTYSMYAGCAKRFTEDCIGKFSNGVNFRGFPHLPGSRVYAGPQ